MSNNIRISQLGVLPSVTTSDDFVPLVDSASLTTYRVSITNFGGWFSQSGSVLSSSWASASYVSRTAVSASWASSSISSSVAVNLIYPNASTSSWAITSSFSQKSTAADTALTCSGTSSFALRATTSSFAIIAGTSITASYVDLSALSTPFAAASLSASWASASYTASYALLAATASYINYTATPSPKKNYAMIYDKRPASTYSEYPTFGAWTKKELNQVTCSLSASVSMSAIVGGNKFTLAAGQYDITISQWAGTLNGLIRLYDEVNAKQLDVGMMVLTNTGGDAAWLDMKLSSILVLPTTTTMSLQYYIGNVGGAIGWLGTPLGFTPEVYTVIKILEM